MSQIVCQLDQLSPSAYASRGSQELEGWGQLRDIVVSVMCVWVMRGEVLVCPCSEVSNGPGSVANDGGG
jgi:hypothetical protein